MKKIMCSVLLIPCFFVEIGLVILSLGVYFVASGENFPMSKYLIEEL